LGIAAYVWGWKKRESSWGKMEFQKQGILYLCPEYLDHSKYVNCDCSFVTEL
jgi:hypothetical protein